MSFSNVLRESLENQMGIANTPLTGIGYLIFSRMCIYIILLQHFITSTYKTKKNEKVFYAH